MDKQYLELIEKYNSGNAAEAEITQIEQLLEDGIIEITDLGDLNAINQKIEKIHVPEPSESMKIGFYSMLAKQKEKASRRSIFETLSEMLQGFGLSTQGVRLAYVATLLVIGIGIGWMIRPSYSTQLDTLSGEMQQMREMMMLSMLEKPSATERLKAVNLTSQINQADEKVITALLTTLNNDENTNVRLATIEALLNYADYPEVRQGLVEAIVQQQSGMVQIALAETMVALKEKSSVEELRKLLEHNHLEEGVKERISESISALI